MTRKAFIERATRIAKHRTNGDVAAAISCLTREDERANAFWLSLEDDATTSRERRVLADIRKLAAK